MTSNKKSEILVHYLERNGKKYKGIKYTNKDDVEAINYEFCDLLVDDAYEFQQIQVPSKNGEIPVALSVNENLKFVSEIEEASKVLIVMVGTSFYDYGNKEYYENYWRTLYVFHDDWLMCSIDTNDLFVVDGNHINLWTENSKE